MEDFNIRIYREQDQEQVLLLWEQCRLLVPQNNPLTDIRLKCAFQPELFFVGEKNEAILSTLMAGYDGHRGWINYLAVLPAYHRRGIGSRMMNHALAALKAMECPKVNLQVRTANTGVIAFYKKLGFTVDDVIGMGKRF